MKIERTKNAKKSIAMGLVLKLHQTVIPFAMRTAIIYLLGVQYLGLHGLFSSVLHVLNLAELGVGSAMVFSMYKPVAEDDEFTICALMRMYRRYYRMIGIVVGTAGLLLTPLVPKLISGEVPEGISVYALYLLNLGSTVLSYWLFAYKNCLLQAHQRTDVTSLIMVITNSLQYLLQLLVLVFWKNYYIYVVVALITQVVNNVTTSVVVTKMYPQYRPRGALPEEETGKINRRIRDLFSGKLGSVIMNYADTIVISAFLGLTTLAIYQNYFFILTSVINMVEILFSSTIAGLGNSFVVETKQKNYRDMEKFSFIFLWGIGVCACCFIGMYQPFMQIWVGEELMLNMAAVICFATYFFIYALNRLLNTYKDAAGIWHVDRFRPLTKAFVNLGLNLLCVRKFGIYGVLLSTVFAIAVVGMPWLLHNLFTHFFEKKQLREYLKILLSHAGMTVLAGAVVCVLCNRICLGSWLTLLLCAIVSVIVPNLLFFAVFRKHRLFSDSAAFVIRLLKQKVKKS